MSSYYIPRLTHGSGQQFQMNRTNMIKNLVAISNTTLNRCKMIQIEGTRPLSPPFSFNQAKLIWKKDN